LLGSDVGGFLLKLGRDARELGVKLSAQTVDDRNNRNGNACGNQAIFYGGGAGLVHQKLHNFGHRMTPTRVAPNAGLSRTRLK
jgi:hypothetical protein